MSWFFCSLFPLFALSFTIYMIYDTGIFFLSIYLSLFPLKKKARDRLFFNIKTGAFIDPVYIFKIHNAIYRYVYLNIDIYKHTFSFFFLCRRLVLRKNEAAGRGDGIKTRFINQIKSIKSIINQYISSSFKRE